MGASLIAIGYFCIMLLSYRWIVALGYFAVLIGALLISRYYFSGLAREMWQARKSLDDGA